MSCIYTYGHHLYIYIYVKIKLRQLIAYVVAFSILLASIDVQSSQIIQDNVPKLTWLLYWDIIHFLVLAHWLKHFFVFNHFVLLVFVLLGSKLIILDNAFSFQIIIFSHSLYDNYMSIHIMDCFRSETPTNLRDDEITTPLPSNINLSSSSNTSLPLQSKASKDPSTLWEHFTKINGCSLSDQKAGCNYCHKTYACHPKTIWYIKYAASCWCL